MGNEPIPRTKLTRRNTTQDDQEHTYNPKPSHSVRSEISLEIPMPRRSSSQSRHSHGTEHYLETPEEAEEILKRMNPKPIIPKSKEQLKVLMKSFPKV